MLTYYLSVALKSAIISTNVFLKVSRFRLQVSKFRKSCIARLYFGIWAQFAFVDFSALYVKIHDADLRVVLTHVFIATILHVLG